MNYHATAYSCFDDPDKTIYNKLTNNFIESDCLPYKNPQGFEIFHKPHQNGLTEISFERYTCDADNMEFLRELAAITPQRIEMIFSGEDELKWKYVIENGKIEEFPLLEIYTKEDLYLMPTKDIIEYLESIGFIVAKKEN